MGMKGSIGEMVNKGIMKAAVAHRDGFDTCGKLSVDSSNWHLCRGHTQLLTAPSALDRDQ
jgi:hypothetical protein